MLAGSTLAARGLRVGVYKPVASGLVAGQLSDAERLLAATGQAWPVERVCPQSFAAPLAPPLAAARVGQRIDEPLLAGGVQWWRGRCDALIVEGVGGACSPLSGSSTVLDLALQLNYPLVLVAGHRLGMINHTLLTLEAIERRGLTPLALVVNEIIAPARRKADAVQLAESLEMLAAFCGHLPCWSLAHGATALSRAAT